MRMNHLLPIVIFLIAPALCFGQQVQSTIEQASATIKTVEVISYQDKEIGSKVISSKQRAVVVVNTEAPNPLVRAYPKSQPFPPVRLDKFSDGKYILYGKPGTTGTIEIISQTESSWWSEYLEYKIGEGTAPEEPPDDGTPDDPDPETDWAHITRFVSSHSIPTNDQATAELYAKSLEEVIEKIETASNFDDAKILARNARAKAMLGRDTFDVDWNVFFVALDQEVSKSPPQNQRDYAEAAKAIMKGLRQ